MGVSGYNIVFTEVVTIVHNLSYKCSFMFQQRFFLFFIVFTNLVSTISRLSLSDGATNDGHSELGSEGEACPFSKDPSGRFVVLYTFTARDENDVDVERGEFVTGKKKSL